jgi:hypothetical protein
VERSLHQFYESTRLMGEWFELPAHAVAEFSKRCQFFEQFHFQRTASWQLGEW